MDKKDESISATAMKALTDITMTANEGAATIVLSIYDQNEQLQQQQV